MVFGVAVVFFFFFIISYQLGDGLADAVEAEVLQGSDVEPIA